jgi:Transposase DDE domain
LPEGRIEYCVLFTNLPKEKYAATEMWGLYQGRQGIEAFLKTCQQTYGMNNLRSTEFSAISAFLWLVFITHNLLQWVKRDLFAGSQLAAVGTHELVSKLGQIVTWRECTAAGWRLHLPSFDVLTSRFVAALTPEWVQLDLRLYETYTNSSW